MRIDDFEWDEANKDKNLIKHNVRYEEAEEVFDNNPRKVLKGRKERYYLYGQTNAGRMLLVVFELKGMTARVISARDMNDREARRSKNKEESEDGREEKPDSRL